ncbi:MAG: hypothetical protein ACOY3P_14505 [Planctomycetota bacterium]
MSTVDLPLVAWGLTLLHALGLACACFVRLSSGLRWEVVFQRMFFALLGMVALANAAGILLFPTAWLPSAFVLALMILMVTWDPRASLRPSIEQ